MPGWPVTLSHTALADFKQLTTSLAEAAGLATAERYIARIDEILGLLSTFPESGAPRPELGQNVRIRVVAPYVIFYVALKSKVNILRILHGKRRITRDLVQE